ncbi:MAG: transglutaminase domain-containing protein [Candidatus Diapherotrites archaeon]|nr:transglutaminase domain-containing protein [Candidatus Diapherotrites archaeon]
MSVDARRRANVEHILRKNEIGGCGDAAVIFAQLARAKGIPVRLVDAVMKGYDGRGDFRGHVFADVFINDKWITVEPVAGRVIGKGYNRIGKDRTIISYIPYAKGLDFSSMGTTTLKAIRRKSSKFLQPG